MKPIEVIPLDEILAARERIAGAALRTPLVKLNVDAAADIYLKLKNLQPIGSFKLRGATNALRKMDRAEREGGVYTASAGNMAQGLAWSARELGISCHRRGAVARIRDRQGGRGALRRPAQPDHRRPLPGAQAARRRRPDRAGARGRGALPRLPTRRQEPLPSLDQTRSNRSKFMTLSQAATKSRTNPCCPSSQA